MSANKEGNLRGLLGGPVSWMERDGKAAPRRVLKQLLYRLRPVLLLHNVEVCTCLLPGVCCPDEMYSKVMVVRLRRESVISQTYSLGNL